MSVVAVAPTPQISLPDELKTVPPIQCGISGCTFSSHVLAKHLQDAHGMSVAQYQQLDVGPVESPVGAFVRQQVEAQRAAVAAAAQPAQVMPMQLSAAANQSADQLHPLRPFTIGHRNMQEKDMFGTGVGTNKDKPFNVRVLDGFGPEDHVPDVDPYYTFDPDVMRWLVTALEVERGLVYAFGPTGCGKCLGKGTPVMMFNGTIKPVEDIALGDLVMGPDSFPRRVTGLARGSEPLYRVVPTKGDPYVVNESHILSLKITGKDEIINISVREYLGEGVTFKHQTKGWRTGVDFLEPAESLPISAYFLGVWLGDGNSENSLICTGDEEIVQALQEYADELGLSIRRDKNGASLSSFMISICQPGGTKFRHPLREALRRYNLIRNKHIPHAFKTASRADRLQLLAGIIDTDGSYGGGRFDLTLKSERLMDDVIFVARSLGFAAYKADSEKTCHNNGKVGSYFRCSITGNIDQVPTRILRKQASSRQQIKDVLKVGITIEPLGIGDYYGFELAGPDRLFLLGDFTVTHNTTVFEQYAARTRRPFAPIQLHAQMEASELTGTWVINANGQMTFQHAMLPIMMRLPSIIVLDEFDNANPAVTPVLNAVLADKPLVIPQTGERIVRHPLCRIVGTGNTAGMGDQTGLYNSTAQQSFATMNRWQMFMEMTYIDPASEARMLKARFTEVPVVLVDKITDFARQIREAFIGGQCSVVLSTRQLIHWLQWFDLTGELPDSYGYAFSNILHGSDRVFCDNLFQRVFGESAKKSRIQLAVAA